MLERTSRHLHNHSFPALLLLDMGVVDGTVRQAPMTTLGTAGGKGRVGGIARNRLELNGPRQCCKRQSGF